MLAPEIRELDAGALRAAYEHRPGVRLGFVESVDGASSLGGRSGALGGPSDLRVLLTLREQADVVLVGAGTVRSEGYGSLGLSADARERRVAAGRSPEPSLAIVSGRGDIPESARPLKPISVGPDIVAGLASMRARGFTRILCEGGPSLAGSLAAAGAVDELCVTVSPKLVGGDTRRILAGAPELGAGLRLEHVLEEESFLFLRYALPR